MKISTFDETAIPPDLDARIRQGLCTCFPKDADVFVRTRAWHGSRPEYTVVAEDAGRVVAHAGVVARTVTVGPVMLRAAGVQNVFVAPEYRGRNLSAEVLRCAMKEAAGRDFDAGLLFCMPELEGVYTGCGWRGLGPRAIVRIAEGRELPLPGGNIALFYPLRVADFPDGVIHLRGNDW